MIPIFCYVIIGLVTMKRGPAFSIVIVHGTRLWSRCNKQLERSNEQQYQLLYSFYDQNCLASYSLAHMTSLPYLPRASCISLVRCCWAELKYGKILAVGGRGQGSTVGGKGSELWLLKGYKKQLSSIPDATTCHVKSTGTYGRQVCLLGTSYVRNIPLSTDLITGSLIELVCSVRIFIRADSSYLEVSLHIKPIQLYFWLMHLN